MKRPILYLRTSTKGQEPELQEKDGKEFCKNFNLGEPEVYYEKSSAYKIEKTRLIWEKVINLAKKEKRDIIVWRYDRAFRNRKRFFKFIKVMFEVYNVKVYSVKEPSILSFWEMLGKKHSDNPVFNELLNGLFKAIWDFIIQQAGEQAEEESKKKSERVKLAVRKKNGITKSYKGNKWGRKSLHTNKINRIKDLRKQGLSYRQIADKEKVSIGKISQILSVSQNSFTAS